MAFSELDVVILNRDLPDHGLRKGDMGAIVLVYSPTNIEVEFVRSSGHTQAVLQLDSTALRAVADGVH